MSHTGIVGMIGGIDLPSIRSTFLAFRAGVEAGAPQAAVREKSLIGRVEDSLNSQANRQDGDQLW